jgi:hypothetical protein
MNETNEGRQRRDFAASQRDEEAAERDVAADIRDDIADERDRLADAREDELDERERQLDNRGRALGLPPSQTEDENLSVKLKRANAKTLREAAREQRDDRSLERQAEDEARQSVKRMRRED